MALVSEFSLIRRAKNTRLTLKTQIKASSPAITPSTKTWSTPPPPPSLTEIMKNEQKTREKQNERKSLAIIEIEERALVELKQYYQLQFPTDSITVVRV